jgi:hypothetical protein
VAPKQQLEPAEEDDAPAAIGVTTFVSRISALDGGGGGGCAQRWTHTRAV